MGSIYEKNDGKKSRATVPLMEFLSENKMTKIIMKKV
jgi:hypothetical protein